MSRTAVILAVIVVAGLGIRLSYLASDPHDPVGNLEGELARGLVAGHGFAVNELAFKYVNALEARKRHLMDPATVDFASLDRNADWQPEVIHSVGEGALLAGLWEVTGSEYFWPMQVLQAIVDAFCALLVFSISLRLFRRRNAALVAAAVYALYFPIAWQTTVLYDDIWAVDFTIAIVACYLEAVASVHRWRWLVVCGLLTGVGVYFRPNLLLLPAILALATIPGAGWRRTLGRALVPSVIALVLLVPWTIRNYRVFHMFIPTRSDFGITVWDGFAQIPNNIGAEPTDSIIDAKIRRVRPDLRPLTPAWDNYLLAHYVVPEIENHPFFYAEGIGVRIIRSTLLAYETPWMRGTVTRPSATPTALVAFAFDHPLDLLESAFYPLVFLFSMLTLGLTWRRWRAQNIFLLAVLLSVLVPYILIYLESRYILPAACAYVVWIGLGIDLLAERARQSPLRRRTSLAADVAP